MRLEREVGAALSRLSGQRKKRTPEGEVQAAVIEHLTLVKRWIVFRRNVGGRPWVDKKGKKRVVLFGLSGQSDLWGLIPEQRGRHFECEVKRAGEVPTLEQYGWMQRVREAGGVAFWVDSVEMLERRLAEL